MADLEAPEHLRDRKRRLVRAEISQLALHFLVAHGYDATTVDDIARAAGVSRRTFFRYFGSKEDVIVGYLDELGDELSVQLAARPAAEPPVEAIRGAFATMIERHARDRAQVLAICRLSDTTPALRARHVDKQDRWQAALARVLAERGGTSPRDMAPRLLAAMAVGTFDVALQIWVEGDGRDDLAVLVDRALESLTALI